ncbi:hypothetical protein WJX81_001032 [Elliptochloris bilobata]|uniref:Uncharacterized protein n=1 Tax=Elliptochloris bilobata TaxID=381761 RepID=A0AAW1RD88_9CHLO
MAHSEELLRPPQKEDGKDFDQAPFPRAGSGEPSSKATTASSLQGAATPDGGEVFQRLSSHSATSLGARDGGSRESSHGARI